MKLTWTGRPVSFQNVNGRVHMGSRQAGQTCQAGFKLRDINGFLCSKDRSAHEKDWPVFVADPSYSVDSTYPAWSEYTDHCNEVKTNLCSMDNARIPEQQGTQSDKEVQQ